MAVESIGGKTGNIGSTANPLVPPEVPSSPTAQDIVDALVEVGIITQAA